MTEERELTDRHVELWREGCAVLESMSRREYARSESETYRKFREIDVALTWPLISPASISMFHSRLDGPCDLPPNDAQAVDWESARMWRHALIQSTGVVPPKIRLAEF
jgi:hypothetical protein